MFKSESIYQPKQTLMTVSNDMYICQSDYPIDWYQEEFIPYASIRTCRVYNMYELHIRWRIIPFQHHRISSK